MKILKYNQINEKNYSILHEGEGFTDYDVDNHIIRKYYSTFADEGYIEDLTIQGLGTVSYNKAITSI